MRYHACIIRVVSLVAIALCSSTGCKESKGQIGPRRTNHDSSDQGHSISSVRSFGGIVTEDGVWLKLVVSTKTHLLDQPLGKRIGTSVDMFDLLYVHDVRMLEETTWFLVSLTPQEGSALGWISSASVRVWRHRVGYRPVRLDGSYVFKLPIYESAQDATAALHGAISVQPIASFDLVPTDDERPMPSNPWPILEKMVVGVNGEQVQIYRVAMLGRETGGRQGTPKPGYTESELNEFLVQLHHLDLLVCIDGTGSMQPWMTSTKEAVAEFSQLIESMDCKPDISAFLTVYRDHDDGKDMVCHFGPKSTSEFCQTLANVNATGGGDAPEAGCEALMQCLQRMTYRPRSQRVLLIVGDSPYHIEKGASNPNGYSLAQIVKEAKEHHVTIFSLSVGSASKERDRQFRTLAQATEGRLLNINNIKDLQTEVKNLLEQQAQTINRTTQVFDCLRKGDSIEDIATKRGMSPDQVSYVVDLLRKTKDIDPNRIGPCGCSVLDGWIAPFCGSAIAGQLEVFCFRSEAREVLSVLRSLHRLEPGLDIGTEIWRVGVDSRTQSTIGDAFSAKMLPFRGSSILSYTQKELCGLSEEQRSALRDDLYLFIKALNSCLLDNRRWFRQTDNTIVGWLPEDSLP